MKLTLKFDLRAPAFGAAPEALYAAALQMSAWADRRGFYGIRLLEHHGSEDGYCPSPLILGAAIAGRTTTVRLQLRALILPLHDPIRIAEDCAVLDLISGGRLDLAVAAGYVPSEFEMFGRDPAERVELITQGVAAIIDAWSGEPFTYAGRRARVALRPQQRPRPLITLGGSSPGAARRAARIADAFDPTDMALYPVYLQECQRLGREPGPRPYPAPVGKLLHVSEDPEASWRRLERHLLHEMNSYGDWLSAAGTGVQYQRVDTFEQLRASGVYRIVTPDECLELARELGPQGRLEFHPLVGGVDPDVGWECLRLVESAVVPVLRAEGLLDALPAPRSADPDPEASEREEVQRWS